MQWPPGSALEWPGLVLSCVLTALSSAPTFILAAQTEASRCQPATGRRMLDRLLVLSAVPLVHVAAYSVHRHTAGHQAAKSMWLCGQHRHPRLDIAWQDRFQVCGNHKPTIG
jgi:hypothetical protein